MQGLLTGRARRTLKVTAVSAAMAFTGLATTAGAAEAGRGPDWGGSFAAPERLAVRVIKPTRSALAFGSAQTAAGIYSNRVFRSAEDGFALADCSSGYYAVTTTDGGLTWEIDSPVLAGNAAGSSWEDVEKVGSDGPRLDFAYQPGTRVIDVTNDGGRSWYQANVGHGIVVSVAVGLQGLVAFADEMNATGTVTKIVQYVSTSGGRRWTRSNAYGG